PGGAARRAAALAGRSRARNPGGARARRAVARRPSVVQRHAVRTATAAGPLPDGAGRRPAARPVGRHRPRPDDAARGADAARRAEEGAMTPRRTGAPAGAAAPRPPAFDRALAPAVSVAGRAWIALLVAVAASACLHRPTPNPNVLVVGVTSGPNNL